MRTLDRYPWRVTLKGWNPKQGRGDSENAGHFASGGSHAGKPTDRTNEALDAAFADEPAKPKPGADSRPNQDLDDFMAMGDEPQGSPRRPWQAKPAAKPAGGQQPQPSQGPPPEGQPDPARGKAHADIAQGHMKMAQQAMKAGDKETAQKLLQAAYGHHLAATHHASGRHAEAEKAKQAADGHLAGVGGGNSKPGQSAGAAASRPGQVQQGKTQAQGKPHEQTQSAAVAAAKAVHQAASSGGDVKAAHAKAHAALDAHHAEGHRAIDRMAAEKHGEGTPRAKAAAEKAKAAFTEKVQAVRAKLDSLAGGKSGTQSSRPSRPERIPPRPPVPSRRGRSTGHPELKALDDRHRKATAAGKRGNPRALGAKVHAILSGLDRHDAAAVRRRYGIPENASPERVGRAWMQWHVDNRPAPRRRKAFDPRHPWVVVKGKTASKFGCLMANLNGDAAKQVLAAGKSILDADLAEDGRETEPHVTVRYGFTEEADIADVERIVSRFGHLLFQFGPVGVFPGDKHDVVYYSILPVEGPAIASSPLAYPAERGLWELHEALADLPHKDTHPEYIPHACIAYVKPGLGEKYRAALDSPRGTFTAFCGELVYSDTDHGRTVIPLVGVKSFDAALASLSVTKAFAEAAHPWLVTKTHDVGDEPRDERGRWVARDNKHPFPIEEDFPFVAPGKITGEMRASAHWHDVPLDGLIATQSWVVGRQVEQMAAAGTERAEKPPVIVRMPDGRRYIEDGHHRATVAAVKGESTVRAKVFDYDPATGEYTAAKVAKQLGAVRHPWVVTKTRDASGHEHASDGRFGRTSGSHDGKKDRPKADRYGKPTERPKGDAGRSSPDAKAERLAARIAEVPKQLRAQVASFVRGRYRKLAKRYGPKGAMAILWATVALLPVPVPGTSLLPIAIAEAVLAIRRAVRKSFVELTPEVIRREARRLLRDVYAACGEEWDEDGEGSGGDGD
jgi:hypothetical protein